MDRVAAGVGVVFEEDDDLGVSDFVGGKHAVFIQACFWARERSCCI